MNGCMGILVGQSVLQIRRGKGDNLGILFHITHIKHMLRLLDP